MSALEWMGRVGALAALVGGALGLYLLTQGPDSYGSYAWHGNLAPLAALLLAVGLIGAYAVQREQLQGVNRVALMLVLGGLVGMGLGYAFEGLWPLIFFGPLLLLPLGFIWLSTSSYRQTELAPWWRVAPLVLGTAAVLGFGIEHWENTSVPTRDYGLTLTQATLSLAWIALGLSLWLQPEKSRHDPGSTA